MINSIFIRWFSLVAFMASLMVAVFPLTATSAPKQIVVTPFQIFAGEDLSYLQKGIQEMLVSRLTSEGNVVVIKSPLPENPAAANLIALANQNNADYVLAGTITVLGGRISTDAKVLDAATQSQVFSFGKAGKDQAEIIDHVDQLAADINARVFGRTPTTSQPAAPSQPKAAPQKPQQPSIYQHPEKLLKDGSLKPDRGSQFSEGGAAGQAKLKMRSYKHPAQIAGVASGDVDGDGNVEIVTISNTGLVLVQRYAQNRWIKIAQFKGVGHYIGVDVMDVNGNGKAEIFVTDFDDDASRVNSFVLELNGKQLERVAKRLNWYFRAIRLPERGKTLVGQRQGATSRFGSGIYEIVYEGGYQAGDRVPLPRTLNVFGFAFGQVRESEDPEIVAYDDNGYVRVLSRSGGEEWLTSDRFGGTDNYILFPNSDDGIEKEYVYLQPHLDLVDMDQDGINEIIVVRNEQSTTALRRSRFFKKGSLVWLKWDELGMRTVLRTRPLAKYVSDFSVADIDGDGQMEVVAAIVQKRAGITSSGTSYLTVYGMEAKQPPQPPRPPQQ